MALMLQKNENEEADLIHHNLTRILHGKIPYRLFINCSILIIISPGYAILGIDTALSNMPKKKAKVTPSIDGAHKTPSLSDLKGR